MTAGHDVPGRGADDVLGSDRDDAAPGLLSRFGAPWRVAAAVALVGLAAWLGPDLLSAADPEEAAPRAARSSPDTPSAAVPWPVRGDLAGDATFLAAALRRVRSDHADADRVLYAGRLPNGGRVVFVGKDRDEPAGVRALDVYALRVPPGADVEAGEVTVVGRGLIESTTLLGWAGKGSDGSVSVVLLSSPGVLEAQVSARIDHSPDGSGSRQWRDVRGSDGSVVVDVGGDTDPVVVARGGGAASLPVMINVSGERDANEGVVEIAGTGGRQYEGPPARALVGAVLDSCTPLLDVRTADIRVIWSGVLQDDLRGALLRIRRPDGPAFQLMVGQSSTGESFAHGPLRVPWEDADVLPWAFESGDPSRPMVLVNPTGAGTGSVSYPGEPPRVVTFDADGTAPFGVGGPSAPNLFGAVVEVRSPAGGLVVKNVLRLVSSQDPLVLDL